MTEQNDNIIRLAGRKYHGETGKLINDATEAPRPNRKKPQAATTLNRQYVHKPDIRRAASIKAADNRAQKSQVKQFNRGLITPSQTGPKAPGISHFKRGDFNKTNKPIVLDIKPNKDVVITAEQNQKFIEAVERAKRVDFTRRYYAAQINRQRRQQNNQIHQTSQNLIKKNLATKQPQAKAVADSSKANLRARQDQVINQAIANTPSSEQLLSEAPVIKFNFKTWGKKHLAGISITAVLLGIVAGLTYLNWSNLVVGFANRQLGLNGHLPAYVVSGFKLSEHPIISNQNLILNYRDVQGNSYTITQTKSSLDSQSVLIKIVKPEVGDEYSIHQQNGLTIYVFGENPIKAVWSNGGVLYQISAQPDLALEKLQRLAISL